MTLNFGYDKWNESEVWLANLMPNNVIMSNGQSDQVTFHVMCQKKII